MDLFRLPSELENSRRILVAGAGGGYDIYAGLPIYQRLHTLGKEVFLASLSSTNLAGTDAQVLSRALYAVEPTTKGENSFFPD